MTTILERLRVKFPVLIPSTVKAEARVAIAQDVLNTLALERMTAARGVYFRIDQSAKGVSEDSYEAVALSMRVKGGRTECTVCAIGAACLSAVSLYDKAETIEQGYDKFGENVEADDMRTILARWFTRKQLDLIECAFEQSSDFQEANSAFDLRQRASGFGGQYWDSRERLEAIMQNIIDNKGTFRP